LEKRRLSPFRDEVCGAPTMFGVEGSEPCALHTHMIGANELLTILRDRGVKNADIATLLELPSSRVAELYSGRRRLRLDEAKKLVEHYRIEERISPLTVPIARQLVLYAADQMGLPLAPDDPRTDELARDFRAFSIFATDPRVRESEEAAAAFFQGLRLAPTRSAGK
jgi:antitoxin component HigA of HigAB toxin-antitoxin module